MNYTGPLRFTFRSCGKTFFAYDNGMVRLKGMSDANPLAGWGTRVRLDYEAAKARATNLDFGPRR